MNESAIVVNGLLSILWIALAIHDIRVHRLDNVATVSAFALAFGYRMGAAGSQLRGTSWDYLLSLGACIAAALVIYATGLVGGGDAKLFLSVLAWRPTVETWIVTLACLATIGGVVLAWSRFQRRENVSRRYPLGSIISTAGLIVLWAL